MEPEPLMEVPVKKRCTCCVACTAVVSWAVNWNTSLHMLGLLKPFRPEVSSSAVPGKARCHGDCPEDNGDCPEGNLA